MGITPTTLTEPMTVAAYEAEMTRVRDFLNAGSVVGDVAAASIERPHVYQPDLSGFPKRSSEGQLQDLIGREFGVRAGADRPGCYTNGRLFVARQTTRMSIHSGDALDTGGFRVGKLSMRLELDVASWVSVAATWAAFVQGSYVYNEYADTAAAGSLAGYFILQYRDVDSAAGATSMGVTRRDVQKSMYGEGTPGTRTLDNLYQTGRGLELSAGSYDLWLNYFAADQGHQVILSHGTLVAAVHRT